MATSDQVGIVDVHHHFVPDYYRSALLEAGIVHPDGMAQIPSWSEAEALATMDRLGIATAFLSISSPGVRLGDPAAAAALARRTNETAADIVRRYPGRFGFFAVTPLPDVTATLAEIAHVFDVLGADGVVFESNFDGVYMGDEALDPVYDELDRRGATIFVHPTSPHCGCGVGAGGDRPAGIALGYPRPMMEFLFETTRTITEMILSGRLDRHPGLNVIVPHAGACLPVLASRIDLLKDAGPTPVADKHVDVRAALRRLHYDLAGAPIPEALTALLSVADKARLLYGSDWPFTPVDACVSLKTALCGSDLLSAAEQASMLHGNARRVFSRLRGAK